MAKKGFFVGMLAVTLVFGMALAGCEQSSGGGGADPNTQYTITVNEPAPADGTASASVVRAKAGAMVTLMAAPASGKKFTGWSGVTVASLAAAMTTFTMPASDVTITAAFTDLAADEYRVTASVTGIGTVSAVPSFGKAGDEIALTVKPATGYKLTALTPGTGTLAPAFNATTLAYTLTLPSPLSADVTVSATFAAIQYTITVPSDVSKGTITAYAQGGSSPALTTAAYGDALYLHITPAENYVLNRNALAVTGASGSKVDGSFNGDGDYRFNMPAENITVSAAFVTPIAMNGTLSIKINGTPVIFPGESYDFRLTAYGNAAYTDYIGSTSTISAGGAWTILIPNTYANKTVYFEFSTRNDGAYYNLGGKTVTTDPTTLSGTFTTKTIGGTVQDENEPIEADIILVSGTAATFASLYTKFMSGEIVVVGQSYAEEGTWTAAVLSDVASAYIMVILYSDESSSDYYITKIKVPLTAGASIALDLATMNFIGTESY
ncbi:MAG: hypothetical protein LBS64_02085 [Spirochaetaceae bacterium]|jgi:hypothetical protein|nr:hypothetical protein [Spirochaetaceae bacterium]